MDPVAAEPQALDIADDTFLVASRATVAELVRDPARWSSWWPDLRLTVTADRGLKGMRWSVAGAAVGSMEIWLEPWGDGVIVHWYLRAVLTRALRRPVRERVQRVLRWKEQVYTLKDELEAAREPGSARCGSDVGVKEHGEPAESQ
jgi:hypothetical protein